MTIRDETASWGETYFVKREASESGNEIHFTNGERRKGSQRRFGGCSRNVHE